MAEELDWQEYRQSVDFVKRMTERMRPLFEPKPEGIRGIVEQGARDFTRNDTGTPQGR